MSERPAHLSSYPELVHLVGSTVAVGVLVGVLCCATRKSRAGGLCRMPYETLPPRCDGMCYIPIVITSLLVR